MITYYRNSLDSPQVETPNFVKVDRRDIVFARGYVLLRNDAKQAAQVPEAWLRTSFDNWTVWHDPRVVSVEARTATSRVLILGNAISLDEPKSNMTRIVKSLTDALDISRTEFLKSLSRLSGKYLVLESSESGTFAQSDALAFSPIYVSPKSRVISSHQNLVRSVGGHHSASEFGRSGWWGANGARTYPGYYTHWQGVFFVPANHQLNLRTLQWSRIPMTPLENLTLNEAVERLEADFSAQMATLSARQPIVGVTAGADSRVSVAASLSQKELFSYFTYGLMSSKRKRLVRLDLDSSQRIAKVLSLKNYEQLIIDGGLGDGSLKRLLQANSPRHSNLNLAAAYLEKFQKYNVHVRSNGFEACTAYYRTVYGMNDATLDNMLRIHVAKGDMTPNTRDAVAEYVETSRFFDADGYDPFDLYFWEIQLGSWQANVMYDSDPTFDSHSIINSRSIISYLNSLPLESRIGGKALKAFTALKSPALASLPINGA